MMMPRRRGENSDDNQFSFSGPMATRGSDEFETWAERIKNDYGYFGRSGKMKQVGAWAKRNHVNPDEGEFTWMAKEDDEDVPSPTLWEKEGGSPASKSDEAYPILGQTMRSQMIARYRKEMIDLVRDAPENAYELSLRDIVEIPRSVKSTELEENKREKETKKETKKKGGRRMARSESLDTGLLLKMFVPATMGRRKSFGVNSTCSKVSPKPVIADAERGGGPEKGPDNEWWKKKEINESSGSSNSGSISGSTSSNNGSSGSSGSRGSTSSNNGSRNRNINNTNNSNTGRRKINGCLPFLHIFKSKRT